MNNEMISFFSDIENQELFETVVNGSSNYWFPYHKVSVKRVGGNIQSIIIDEKEVKDFNDAKKLLFNLSGYKHIKRDVLVQRSACDATSADILLQLAAFGKVFYA